jgi:hypothetical protein
MAVRVGAQGAARPPRLPGRDSTRDALALYLRTQVTLRGPSRSYPAIRKLLPGTLPPSTAAVPGPRKKKPRAGTENWSPPEAAEQAGTGPSAGGRCDATEHSSSFRLLREAVGLRRKPTSRWGTFLVRFGLDSPRPGPRGQGGRRRAAAGQDLHASATRYPQFRRGADVAMAVARHLGTDHNRPCASPHATGHGGNPAAPRRLYERALRPPSSQMRRFYLGVRTGAPANVQGEPAGDGGDELVRRRNTGTSWGPQHGGRPQRLPRDPCARGGPPRRWTSRSPESLVAPAPAVRDGWRRVPPTSRLAGDSLYKLARLFGSAAPRSSTWSFWLVSALERAAGRSTSGAGELPTAPTDPRAVGARPRAGRST